MRRLPIRVRVTAVFALVMAALLAALGAFIWLELRSRLDETIDDSLRSRMGEITGFVASAEGLRRNRSLGFGDEDETFVQILRRDGSVSYASQAVGEVPLLEADELPAGGESDFVELERESVPAIEGGARLLAAPIAGAGGEPSVLVVGASLDDRDETLSSLATLLVLGGPIALALACLAGYAATGAALRPVEAMRKRAAEISASEAGDRLPVPPADDELARLGHTLNEMLARLGGAIERERRFVDDASHELRTPLALHRAELELALRHGGDPAELRRSIASAIEEVDRLIALAEALLVVARSGERGLALAREPLRVSELLDTIARRFRARAGETGRAVEVSAHADVTVRSDRIRLEQALTAVVDNAFRHGAGAVRLTAEREGDRVLLRVRDEGPGFPDGFEARAFERFSRGDSARGRGGAGLGLAIVQVVAAAHGGGASARNLPEGGAEVTIQLPALGA